MIPKYLQEAIQRYLDERLEKIVPVNVEKFDVRADWRDWLPIKTAPHDKWLWAKVRRKPWYEGDIFGKWEAMLIYWHEPKSKGAKYIGWKGKDPFYSCTYNNLSDDHEIAGWLPLPPLETAQ